MQYSTVHLTTVQHSTVLSHPCGIARGRGPSVFGASIVIKDSSTNTQGILHQRVLTLFCYALYSNCGSDDGCDGNVDNDGDGKEGVDVYGDVDKCWS